jgi:ABC-type polysaccharide/polyol phosphate export permease
VRDAGFRLEGETTPVPKLVRDVADSSDLISILARQTFFVQYRRAVFGLLWSILLPLIQAIVLALVLTRVTNLGRGHGGSSGFVTFIFSGNVAWAFLSGSLTLGATSIVNGSGLTTKVYFPRAVLPIVAVAANAYGLVAGTLVLIAECLVTGVSLTGRLVLLPVAMVVAVLITSGFTLVLSALHVYFRDIRYIVTAALQPWFYITPIFYSLDRIGGARPLIEANPMTGVVLLFRWATIGTSEPLAVPLYWTLGWTVALITASLFLYRRFERVFADLI